MSHGGLGTAGGDTQGGWTVRMLGCRVEVQMWRRRARGAGIARRRGSMCLYKQPSVQSLSGLLLKTLPFVQVQFGFPR